MVKSRKPRAKYRKGKAGIYTFVYIFSNRISALENIIELRHISRTFDDGFRVVEDFNLTIQRGEFVTFLGPSGCGKTTTLRMIAGFEEPTEGELLLNGKDIRKLPPNKRPSQAGDCKKSKKSTGNGGFRGV